MSFSVLSGVAHLHTALIGVDAPAVQLEMREGRIWEGMDKPVFESR